MWNIFLYFPVQNYTVWLWLVYLFLDFLKFLNAPVSRKRSRQDWIILLAEFKSLHYRMTRVQYNKFTNLLFYLMCCNNSRNKEIKLLMEERLIGIRSRTSYRTLRAARENNYRFTFSKFLMVQYYLCLIFVCNKLL